MDNIEEEETAKLDEENGKMKCTGTTTNCTGEFSAQPNDSQEKVCYMEEKDTHEGYTNRSANCDMPTDQPFDTSVIDHGGEETGSMIHEEEDKHECDGADREENRKVNNDILCEEIKAQPKDENASSHMRGSSSWGLFYPAESCPWGEAGVAAMAAVAGGTAQMGHTGEATQASPNRSTRHAGEREEKLSTNCTCTRDNVYLGHHQQSTQSAHMHNQAKEEEKEGEDGYCKIGTHPTVSAIRVETTCRNDPNNDSVRIANNFGACKQGTEKRKEEIFDGGDEEGEIVCTEGYERIGALRTQATLGDRTDAIIGASGDVIKGTSGDVIKGATGDTRIAARSEAWSRTLGKTPSTDQRVGEMSNLSHNSSKYTQSAFRKNTNKINNDYHLANEEIGQNNVIIKKKTITQEGVLCSTPPSAQDIPDENSLINRTPNYTIGQNNLFNVTATSDLRSDNSRGSGEKGEKGGKGDSTILIGDFEEHARIVDEQNCTNSTLVGSAEEFITVWASEKSCARPHVKSHVQSDEASDTPLDVASRSTIRAHPDDDQSNLKPDENRRRKGTCRRERVKIKKKQHFLNISRGSNTIGRRTNLSFEHHHYQSFFHPKGTSATPSTAKYDRLRGEHLTPNHSSPTQEKDNVNKTDHDELEEYKMLVQHSEKGKTITENCQMDSSDMIELIIKSHVRRTSSRDESVQQADVHANVCAVENNPRSKACYVPNEEAKPAHSEEQSGTEQEEPPSGMLLPEGAFPHGHITNHGRQTFVNRKTNELLYDKDEIEEGVDNVEKGYVQRSHLRSSVHGEKESAMLMRLTIPVSTTPQVGRVTRMSSLKRAQANKGKDFTKSIDHNFVLGKFSKEGESIKGRHHDSKKGLSSNACLSSSEGSDGCIDADDQYDGHNGVVLDRTAISQGFPSSLIRSSGPEWKNGSPINSRKYDENTKSERSDVHGYNMVGRFRGEGEAAPLVREGRRKHPKYYKEACEDSSESHMISNNCHEKAHKNKEDYHNRGVHREYTFGHSRQRRPGREGKQTQPYRTNRPSDALSADVKSKCETRQEAISGRNGRNYVNKPEIKVEQFRLHNGIQGKGRNRDNSTLDDELHQWTMEGGGGHADDDRKNLQGGPKDDRRRKNMFLVNGRHRIKHVEGTWNNDKWCVDTSGMMKLRGTQSRKRDERRERNGSRGEQDKCARNDADSDDSVGPFGRRTDRSVHGNHLEDGQGYNDVGDQVAGQATSEGGGEVAEEEDQEDPSHLCEIQRHIDYIMQNDDIDFSRISIKPSKKYVKINLFIDRYILSYNELQNSELLFCFGESSEEDVMTRKRSSMKEGDYDGDDDSQNDALMMCARKKNGISSYKKKNKQQKNRKINYNAIDTMWQPHFHPHNKEFRVRYRYKGSMRLKTISCKHYGYVFSKKISILFLFRWLLCGKYIAEKTKRSRLSITDINDCNLSDLLSKKRNKNNGYMTDEEWKAMEEKKSKEFYDHVHKINDFFMSNYKDDTFLKKLQVIINSCDKQFRKEEILNILNQCLRDKLISERRRDSLLRRDSAVDTSLSKAHSAGNTLSGPINVHPSGRRDQSRDLRQGHVPRLSALPVNTKKRKRTFNTSAELYSKENMDEGSINHSSSGSSGSSGSSRGGNEEDGDRPGHIISNTVGDSMGEVSFTRNKRKKESFFRTANGRTRSGEGANVDGAQVSNKDEQNAMCRGRYSRKNETDTETGNNGQTLYHVGVTNTGMNYPPVPYVETEVSDEGGTKMGDRSRSSNPQVCKSNTVIVDRGVHIGHMENAYEGCGGDGVFPPRSGKLQPHGNDANNRRRSGRAGADSIPSNPPDSTNPLASYPSYEDLEKLSNTEEIREYYNSLIELKKSLYIKSQHGDVDDQVRYANINDHFMELLNKESRKSSSNISSGRHKGNSNHSMDPQDTKPYDAFLFAIYYANRKNASAGGAAAGTAVRTAAAAGGGERSGMSPHSVGDAITTPGKKPLSPPTHDETNTPPEQMQKIDFNMEQKKQELVTELTYSPPFLEENNYLNAYPNLNNINSSKKISNVSTCPSLVVSSYSAGKHTQGDKNNMLSCSVSNERNKIGTDVTTEEKLDYVKEQLKRKSFNRADSKELFNSCAEKYSPLMFSKRNVFLKHVREDGHEAEGQSMQGSEKGTAEENHHELLSLGDASTQPYTFMDRHNNVPLDKYRKDLSHMCDDENELRVLPVREQIILEKEKKVTCVDGRNEQQHAYRGNPRELVFFPSQRGKSGEGGCSQGRNDQTREEEVQAEREAEMDNAEPLGSLRERNDLGDENMKDIIDILVKSKYLRESMYDDSLSSNVECSHERGRSNSRCLYCACIASLNGRGVEVQKEDNCTADKDYKYLVEDALKGGDHKDGNLDRGKDNVERHHHPSCDGEENNLCNSSCQHCIFYTKLLRLLRQNKKDAERGKGYGMNKECDKVDTHISNYLNNMEGSSLMGEEMLKKQVSGGNNMPPAQLCNRIFTYLMQKGGSERLAHGSAKDMPGRSEQHHGGMEDGRMNGRAMEDAEVEKGQKQHAVADAMRSGRASKRTKREIISAFLQDLFNSLPSDDLDVQCSASLSHYMEEIRTGTHDAGEDENGEFANNDGENTQRYDYPYDGVRNFPRSVAPRDQFERAPLRTMPYAKTNTERKRESSEFARKSQTNEFLPLPQKQTHFIMNKNNLQLITNFINDVKVKNYITCSEMKDDHRTFHDRQNSIADYILPQQSNKSVSLQNKKNDLNGKNDKTQNGHANEDNNYAAHERESEGESEKDVLGPYTRKALNEKRFEITSHENVNNLFIADSINNNVVKGKG
ncbi:hypothetical protein AK88_02252 [Plasmodium fragile]|uniref:Uncharacterized protein n=1 Tax=Plasmodium fragile TaxID=5857 RepID=A0A0D9QM48_PLAFR|nr:uncharacterized protein AK88_02252 [Plasmodium fragile]KJP88135.1 hypothetical protein AK88_02252 [Plasmodium fragile]